MSDLQDKYIELIVFDTINYPIVIQPNSIEILVPHQLFSALWPCIRF
jgi:hypothetical protein